MRKVQKMVHMVCVCPLSIINSNIIVNFEIIFNGVSHTFRVRSEFISTKFLGTYKSIHMAGFGLQSGNGLKFCVQPHWFK